MKNKNRRVQGHRWPLRTRGPRREGGISTSLVPIEDVVVSKMTWESLYITFVNGGQKEDFLRQLRILEVFSRYFLCVLFCNFHTFMIFFSHRVLCFFTNLVLWCGIDHLYYCVVVICFVKVNWCLFTYFGTTLDLLS